MPILENMGKLMGRSELHDSFKTRVSVMAVDGVIGSNDAKVIMDVVHHVIRRSNLAGAENIYSVRLDDHLRECVDSVFETVDNI